MLIFDRYLKKHAVYEKLIQCKPESGLFLIVVIPCHNEQFLIRSLESLEKCGPSRFPAEIIVVVNHSVSADKNIVARNEATYTEALLWAEKHSKPFRRFHIIKSFDFIEKDSGVGLARKTGTDEAVRRFMEAGNPNGVIAGFDADCLCSENYLSEVEDSFYGKDINGASVYFEHPLTGNESEENVYRSAEQYELHLRYYKNALKWSGFPFAYHTVGSSFAVRADVYCRQGGMNKRKAGEDFYFLSKVIPLGRYSEINKAVVFPSPRASDRVPFGTGAAVGKMIANNETIYRTYPFELFVLVKEFFADTEKMFNTVEYDMPNNVLGDYCRSVMFAHQLKEIKANTAGYSSFTKRFFMVFNAFKVLKFLNFAIENGYRMSPVEIESKKLLGELKITVETRNLTEIFREIDRG